VLPTVAYEVVCISSSDGAGAEEAAALVGSSLGFRIINEDIVARAAIEAGVEQAVVADVERRKSLLVRVIEGMGAAGSGAGLGTGFAVAAPGERSDDLRGLIMSVIEEMAAKGSAVIVAHAASMALGGRQDVLRVLITASTPTRVRRLAASGGGDEQEAGRFIKRSDAGRADYLKRFYDVGAEQPTHYDMVLNTDKLTPEDAARLIVQAAGGRIDSEQPVA
jgi:cytidylate kinase